MWNRGPEGKYRLPAPSGLYGLMTMDSMRLINACGCAGEERPAGEPKAPSAARVWVMAARALIDTVVGCGAGGQVVCGLQQARLDPGGLH